MTREIKFRAWDRSCNRMFNTITELWFGNNDYFKELFFNQAFHFKAQTETKNGIEIHQATSQDCILMQYTGLHDKNGKEIYEGDIVSWTYGQNNEVREVKWIISEAMFLPNCMAEDPVVEVIGNIYENPELLK